MTAHTHDLTDPGIPRPEPDRGQTIAGLLIEYRAFAQLLTQLDDAAWTQPTRCVGWEVADVAGHVVGQLLDTVSGAIGTRTADEQAAALRDESPRALAAKLHAAADVFAQVATAIDDTAWCGRSPISDFTLGQGVHALLNDAYVHADDIRESLGLAYDRGPGLLASLDFVLGALIRLDVTSIEPRMAPLLAVPVAGFSAGTGIDAHDFLLAATGRLDAARLALPESVNIYR